MASRKLFQQTHLTACLSHEHGSSSSMSPGLPAAGERLCGVPWQPPNLYPAGTPPTSTKRNDVEKKHLRHAACSMASPCGMATGRVAHG